jgi:hypothetical protein
MKFFISSVAFIALLSFSASTMAQKVKLKDGDYRCFKSRNQLQC